MTKCVECGKRKVIYCADCVEDIKAGYGDYIAMKFFDGIKNITGSLERAHIENGTQAANDIARVTYSEYMNTKEKTLFDYGVMIGALEWLEHSQEAAAVNRATGEALNMDQGIYKP